MLVASSYGFLAVAGAGIVQAQLNFVPEFRELRRRRLPSHLTRPAQSGLSLQPLLSPNAGGAELGLRARF